MNNIRKIFNISISTSFAIIGLIQSIAIYSFFRDFWEWWIIPSIFASWFVSYIPILGSICGYLAIHNVWRYSSFTSILIVGFPLWFSLLLSILFFITFCIIDNKKLIIAKIRILINKFI
ncbi:MAG: hypothetical protein RL208_330 [Pseudomonadota bacterium]|jgi:hypothetical protein